MSKLLAAYIVYMEFFVRLPGTQVLHRYQVINFCFLHLGVTDFGSLYDS